MALDRQSIERRDFPISRRGYEIEAVDAHLQLVADEYESLRRSQGRARSDSLASAASEQVRLIVEAAEQSAADIEREAELEARQIRQDAREAAERQRTEAGQQAREHVQTVAEAAQSMLERVESMERELASLLDALRGGAQRVSADLSLLQASVGDVRGAAAVEPERPAPALAAAPEPPPAPEPEPEPEPVAEAAPAAAETAGNGGEPAGGDEEGARLIALNMALNGTPREETERYLADNFDLEDTQALLDDVYARAGQ